MLYWKKRIPGNADRVLVTSPKDSEMLEFDLFKLSTKLGCPTLCSSHGPLANATPSFLFGASSTELLSC